jgi:hypothetical protein
MLTPCAGESSHFPRAYDPRVPPPPADRRTLAETCGHFEPVVCLPLSLVQWVAVVERREGDKPDNCLSYFQAGSLPRPLGPLDCTVCTLVALVTQTGCEKVSE